MNNTTSVFDYEDNLDIFCSIMMTAMGFFGVITNFSVIFIFCKEKSERTAFNLICLFRAISNIIILISAFFLVFLPTTILGYSFYPPMLESILINIAISIYLGNEYQIILVATNRFCALFFPTYYSRICGKTPTLTILIAFYVYRIFDMVREGIEYNEYKDECYTSYSLEFLSWTYDPRIECTRDNYILQVIFYTFATMTTINVITFLKIISFYLKRQPNRENHESMTRIRKNGVLFFQTVLQDSLYLIDMTFTIKLSGLSDSRFWTFISGTFVWESIHSIDGFIMIMFNERLSLLKKSLKILKVTPSSRQTSLAQTHSAQ